MIRNSGWAFLLASGAALLAGCGGSDHPKTVPVIGTVTYQGKPVEAAEVTFFSDRVPRAAIGTTDSQGKFRLSTFDNNDGAIPGEYVVTITKKKATDTGGAYDPANPGASYGKAMTGAAVGANPTAADELPAKYGSRGTSGLTKSVTDGGPNDFPFELQ